MTRFLLLMLVGVVIIHVDLFAQINQRDSTVVYDTYVGINTDSDDEVYDLVEVAACFPGGQDSLWTFIDKNINSSKESNRNKSTKLVLIKFVIEKNGCLSNTKILMSSGDNYDHKAMRIIEAMPKWIPATQDGKPVRAFMTLPFRF